MFRWVIDVRALRDLERLLFRAWCIWLCTPGLNERQERQARDQFQAVARQMEDALAAGGGSWLDPDSEAQHRHGLIWCSSLTWSA